MDKRPTYEELEKQVRELQIEIGEIRKTKQAIKESEVFHRLTLENISDTVIITDDHGKIIYVCPNSVKIFGLSQKQISAKGTIQELINGHACDLSELKKLKEISNIEWNVVDSSGQDRSVLITVKSVFINGGSVLYVIHDNTALKKNDENLRNYKNIVSSTPDGIALLDENYKYILVNDSYERFSGLNREDFIGKAVSEYLGQEIFDEFIKPNFDRCLKGEIIHYQEWFEYPKLGRRFVDVTYFPYYDKENSRRGIIANTRDITDYKKNEELRRQVQKMLARTERIAHIGSWEWEIATDTVTWSEELYRIFQIDPNEKAPNWAEHPKLYHPEDFERLRKAAEITIKNGTPYEIELRAFRKDGETRACLASGFAELGKKEKPVRLFGSLHDITERKEIEASLAKSESLFRGLYDNMPSGSAIYKVINDGSKGSDYIIINFNHKSLEIEGKTLDQVVGKSLYDLRPNIDDYGLIPVMKNVWETGEPAYFPIKIYQDEIFSNYYENYIFKIPTGEVVTIYNDVTDQKNADKALKESEERFALAMEFANDGLFDWNLKTNKIYYSPVWKRMLGYENDELPNDFSVWETLTEPEDVKRSWKMQNELINRKRDKFEIEFKMRHKDGHWMDILSRANAIFDENNKAVRLVGTHVDISERKRLESQLLQSQKLESIGTLAGGIAHEFNNILSIIIGNNELIMEDLPEWSLSRENAEEIRLAGLRARDIVKHLLTFSRQDSSTKKPINIGGVVKESLKLIRATIPTNIEITEKISPDCLPIFGDSTQINQILINLCNNAAAALPISGGKIDIELCNTVLKYGTGSSTKQLSPGKYLKLSVQDNGSGMEKHILDRIFEPYFTTKDIGEGSGIGLAVVHGIVENNGGSIVCESAKGMGTTFTILIPAHEGSVKEEFEKQNMPTGKGESILYVDDEPSIAKLGKRHLKSLGYSAFSTTDPAEALELIKTEPDRFDLVISDMAMPKMPGDQLITEILAINPEIPTIICTGYSSRMSETDASKIGVKAFLMKPLKKAELAEKIRKVLDNT